MKKLLLCLFVTMSLFSEEISKNAKIFVAGHNGLVGRAICRKLSTLGYFNIITKSSKELDLRDQKTVLEFFEREKPEYVFLSAAKVGGIIGNQQNPASFIYDNLMIQTNIIHSSYLAGVKKLLFLGSSCIYPRMCSQPIKEEYLLTGPLEITNYAYAIAKIAGLKMCKAYNTQYNTKFISCMPTNLYGPFDNYNLTSSHVIPALISKIYTAKLEGKESVEIWGTGRPKREFLHVDDLADACIFLMDNYEESEVVNVGTGQDVSIKEVAYLIKEIIGYKGEFYFNTSKPDGTPRKLLDVSKINDLGWSSKIELKEGLKDAIQWYLDNQQNEILKK